jgi:hypothetical protein
MTDQERRLRGTFERTRSVAGMVRGRVALTEVLPPPNDLDLAAQREWQIHMALCVSAGTISHTNLAAFQALTETAALRRKAYRRALKASPVAVGERGTKVSPAWTAFAVVDAAYCRWASAFGLRPRAAAGLPQLPVPGTTRLEVV